VLALTKYFSSTENTAMDWCLPIVLKLGAKKTTRKGAYQLHFEEQFKSATWMLFHDDEKYAATSRSYSNHWT
jgi:hypothetical protein